MTRTERVFGWAERLSEIGFAIFCLAVVAVIWAGLGAVLGGLAWLVTAVAR